MQADLAYAYEHITRDYPKPTDPSKGKISTVSDYFRNIRTHSIHPRVSVGYDFRPNDKFKPYIGVRVGYGHVRHGIDSTKKITGTLTAYPNDADAAATVYPDGHPQKNTYQKSNSSRRLGFGAMAGVGIDVAPGLTLDAGYRYHYWGRLENTRFKTHEASLGMRYRF
ncbi:TPA: outer membrane beta-barrel protein [Neisseria gonorrhoeae]